MRHGPGMLSPPSVRDLRLLIVSRDRAPRHEDAFLNARDDRALLDPSQWAIAPYDVVMTYEIRPRQEERVTRNGDSAAAKQLQFFEGSRPTLDIISIVVRLIAGGSASRVGGLCSHVGAIIDLIGFRTTCFSARTVARPAMRAKARSRSS